MKIGIATLITTVCLLAACSSSFENKIETAVKQQLSLYPNSTLQDIYKNFFQDRMGAGHAVPDTAAARQYLESELASFSFSANPMVEVLGWENRYVRVNLQAIKDGKVSVDELFSAFLKSAQQTDLTKIKEWQVEWNKIIAVIEKMKLNLSGFERDKAAIDSLLKKGKYALHHSQAFSNSYDPHYRIIERSVYEEYLKSVN